MLMSNLLSNTNKTITSHDAISLYYRLEMYMYSTHIYDNRVVYIVHIRHSGRLMLHLSAEGTISGG